MLGSLPPLAHPGSVELMLFCADLVAAVKIQKHYTNWIHLGNILGKPILHSSTDEGSHAPHALLFPRITQGCPCLSSPAGQSLLPPQHMGCAVSSLEHHGEDSEELFFAKPWGCMWDTGRLVANWGRAHILVSAGIGRMFLKWISQLLCLFQLLIGTCGAKQELGWNNIISPPRCWHGLWAPSTSSFLLQCSSYC